MIGLGVLFLPILVQLVVSQSLLDDPCYLTAWSSPQPDPGSGIVLIQVPDGCTGGAIHWDYPTGSLHLTATRPRPQFSLCVGKSFATVTNGVYDITGGQNVSLPLPTDDNPSCAQSQNGQADLQVIAPDMLMYMIALTYSVE